MSQLFHHDPDVVNTAAVVTLTDTTPNILKIGWSYDGDGTGSLTVTVGGTQKEKRHITKGGPGELVYDNWQPGTGSTVITLAAVAAIKGTVSVEAD